MLSPPSGAPPRRLKCSTVDAVRFVVNGAGSRVFEVVHEAVVGVPSRGDEQLTAAGERLAGGRVDCDGQDWFDRGERGRRHAARCHGVPDHGRRGVVIGQAVEQERRLLGVADVANDVVSARRRRRIAAELRGRAGHAARAAVSGVARRVDAVIDAADERADARDAAVAAARPAGAGVANSPAGAFVVLDARRAIAVHVAHAARTARLASPGLLGNRVAAAIVGVHRRSVRRIP